MKSSVFYIVVIVGIAVLGWLFISRPPSAPTPAGSLAENVPISDEQAAAKVGQAVPAPVNPETLPKAPDLTLKDYSGKTVKFSSFGKPLVINSWAAWCPFCRKELADFAAVQKEFKDKVVIIAIDRAESLAIAKKYSDELGVTNDLVFLLDPSDSFYQAIGGFSMPETIFVDKNGGTVHHSRGQISVEEMRERIQKIL